MQSNKKWKYDQKTGILLPVSVAAEPQKQYAVRAETPDVEVSEDELKMGGIANGVQELLAQFYYPDIPKIRLAKTSKPGTWIISFKLPARKGTAAQNHALKFHEPIQLEHVYRATDWVKKAVSHHLKQSPRKLMRKVTIPQTGARHESDPK